LIVEAFLDEKYEFFKIAPAKHTRIEATIIFSSLEKSSPLSKKILILYVFKKENENDSYYFFQIALLGSCILRAL